MYSVLSQDCLQAAEGRTIKVKYDKDIHEVGLPLGTQAIITSYKFECCGNITQWLSVLEPENRKDKYIVKFQVWRPSPTVEESGCYSMVGENSFRNVVLMDHYRLRERPEPSDIITVQPGDVVGYYVVFTGEIELDNGVLLDNRYSTNAVWYHTGTDTDPIISGGPKCPFPVGTGSDRSLKSRTNAAPLLSMSICK